MSVKLSSWYLSQPCGLGCVFSMPKFWLMQWEKEICQTSYLVLSSPKQWVDRFSSSYFGKTRMASVALFWLSKYFLCLFPHLNVHESSLATLNYSMELHLAQTLHYSSKRFTSFLFLFQMCSTNSLFLDTFLDPPKSQTWVDMTMLDIPSSKTINLFVF